MVSAEMDVGLDGRAAAGSGDDAALAAFHAGDRAVLERCYAEHLETVNTAVGAVLSGADRETVVHEVFLRLIEDARLRRGFHGGSLPAWLRVVARNQAIDYARRRAIEAAAVERASNESPASEADPGLEERISARLVVERFRAEVLPRKWRGVFEARFVEQQDQPRAARALGLSRTTLAYREYRIRRLLRKFVLRGGGR
jgi:RNA polymerase sigma-70 factor (ECF subfamily)